ncbi:MAG: DinB family protein [Phycisphaerae bacterium]|nr:DinB family protein [Phycisphaerae bacterium]
MNTATDAIGRLHEHRRWFRVKMIEALKSLSPEEQRRTFPMGPGSAFAVAVHCWGAETGWISAVEGATAAMTLPGAETFPTLDSLLDEWKKTDARWDRFLAAVTDADLGKPVARVRDGKTYTTTLADVLIHVTTHQMYHAAQFKNMLRQLGKTDLPPSDFIMFGREKWNA